MTCHVTFLGGGFGRKSKPDYAVEAAVLSKRRASPSKSSGAARTTSSSITSIRVAAMYIKAAVDDKGMPKAWLQRSVFPPISSTFDKDAVYGSDWRDVARAGMSSRLMCRTSARRTEGGGHVRIGWLRSVANIYHAFAVQSFANELAYAANRDPYDYLLASDRIGPCRSTPSKVLPTMAEKYPYDTARLRHVAQLAADKSELGKEEIGQRMGHGHRRAPELLDLRGDGGRGGSRRQRRRCGFRTSIPRSMPGSSPIRTWCARSFRERPCSGPASPARARSRRRTASSISRISINYPGGADE